MNNIVSKSREPSIELAVRLPLPPSRSTLLLQPPESQQSHQINDFEESNRISLHNDSSLPPVDRGVGAWSFLAAAFLVEGIVWGFPDAFGVFLDTYLNDATFTSQKDATTLLPLIGPVANGIIYCTAPFITPVISRYPRHRRTGMYIGLVLCWVSLFAASYTTRVIHLVALQGVLYAIGGSLLYFPCVSYLSEWFLHRRGLANGVLFAGTGAGGIVLPLTLSKLISLCGPAKTLRYLSIAIAVLVLPLLFLVKGRLPESRAARVRGPTPRGSTPWSRGWLNNSVFWILLISNTVQGFAYFVPLLWLPVFAGNLNPSKTVSSATLAVFHTGSLFGRLSMGYLSDKYNFWILALSTLFATSTVTFILWGVFSYSTSGLFAFSIMYGVCAGGWPSIWTGFMKPLTTDDPTLSTTLFGILLFSRGVGNIFSTPISSALSGLSTSSNMTGVTTGLEHASLGFQVDGGRFETMIVYAGSCFAGAALIVLFGWGTEVTKSRARRVAHDDSEHH